MSQTPVPDWLPGYFAAREKQRAEDREEAFGKLTEREQRLCRDFAVMGYVRGTFRGIRHDEPFPRDSTILADVLDGMLSSAGEAMEYARAVMEVDA